MNAKLNPIKKHVSPITTVVAAKKYKVWVRQLEPISGIYTFGLQNVRGYGYSAPPP